MSPLGALYSALLGGANVEQTMRRTRGAAMGARNYGPSLVELIAVAPTVADVRKLYESAALPSARTARRLEAAAAARVRELYAVEQAAGAIEAGRGLSIEGRVAAFMAALP